MKPRLFAVSKDGSAMKVRWESEFVDSRLAPCDLYERALDIEAIDYLPVAFQKEPNGSYSAAICQDERILYRIFDLSFEQKYYLEDFSLFVQRSFSVIRTVRVRSFHAISKVRIWRAFQQSVGWEQLNTCEMDVVDALQGWRIKLN